jgi:hypothetical protein
MRSRFQLTVRLVVQTTLAANQAWIDPEPLQERRQAFTDRKTETRDLPEPRSSDVATGLAPRVLDCASLRHWSPEEDQG